MNLEEMKLLEKKAMEKLDEINQDEWRLKLHLMPPVGWLNDPNGLCQFHGIYHVYYQYSPYDVNGKTKFWGHYISKDLLHWKREETVFYPDHRADCHGVYSGSTYLKDQIMHVFYTGNVKHTDKDYDYINEGREQNLIYVQSRDGFQFTEKQWLLSNCDLPDTLSCHVRDPKIFTWKQQEYMVLGARDKNNEGCVLILKSDDLNQWTYETIIRSEKPFGYMWECPDMQFIDGNQILITCPQGVKPDGINYANVHQCGYFMIKKGSEGTHCILEKFHQLDRGHDFYAPQTFLDEKGRTIMIGWMGLPDIDYKNPTVEKGWQHALTLPRELFVQNGRLCQRPVEELKKLRSVTHEFTSKKLDDLTFNQPVYEIEMNVTLPFELSFSPTCQLKWDDNKLTLSMQESGMGRKERSVYLNQLNKLQIFVDTSSIEIFVNDGEEVFTSRYYEKLANRKLRLVNSRDLLIVHELDSLEIDWNLN